MVDPLPFTKSSRSLTDQAYGQAIAADAGPGGQVRLLQLGIQGDQERRFHGNQVRRRGERGDLNGQARGGLTESLMQELDEALAWLRDRLEGVVPVINGGLLAGPRPKPKALDGAALLGIEVHKA